MKQHEELIRWLENGRQIGSRFSFFRAEESCWSSVGIQKWNDKYKVYVDEIRESQMAMENYDREEILEFDAPGDAIKYVDEKTLVKMSDLKPCKGQKVFNPRFG